MLTQLFCLATGNKRGCAQNRARSCRCQGDNVDGGTSLSYGCAFSIYNRGCKFSRGPPSEVKAKRRFRLDREDKVRLKAWVSDFPAPGPAEQPCPTPSKQPGPPPPNSLARPLRAARPRPRRAGWPRCFRLLYNLT